MWYRYYRKGKMLQFASSGVRILSTPMSNVMALYSVTAQNGDHLVNDTSVTSQWQWCWEITAMCSFTTDLRNKLS
jgi:hypothetical protein